MTAEVSHRAGLLVAAAAAAPFVAGALLYAPHGGDLGGPQLVCPFRAATGLPCPLCGGTRAVVLAAHGDGAFLHYNAVAVLALVAAIVVGLVALAPRAGRRARAMLARPGWVLAGVAVIAWAWTLTHRATIIS